jgi:hypothetical protein
MTGRRNHAGLQLAFARRGCQALSVVLAVRPCGLRRDHCAAELLTSDS